MTNKNKINFYTNISLLIVENNLKTVRLYKAALENNFSKVVFAHNEEEALSLFKQQHFGMLICQHNLPSINGLKFIRSLRILNKVVPILFATAPEDSDTFQQALKLNITHFLSQLFSKGSLIQTLEEAYEPVLSYYLCQKSLADELDVLKDQKTYDNIQHQHAFLKEHQAIRNDFYYNYYKHPSQDNLWYLDGSYQPHDILSGDTYSIRRIHKEKSFFFIIDAMGKGVSASVTSIVASSYINHLIDLHSEDFDFKLFVENFNTYITKNLLDEEVLAVLFAELDFSSQTLAVSSYGMPPVLLCEDEGTVIKVKNNNMPISKHNNRFNIDSFSIKKIKKMLFYSDGLIESALENDELYFSHLKKDFRNSKSRSSFLKKLNTKVPHPDDDITLLFFQKLEPKHNDMVSVECKTSLTDVDKVIESFHEYLKENRVDQIHTAKLGMVFTEMMMNAYEHGNLNISNAYKKELILEGNFDNECKKRELQYKERHITVNYLLTPNREGKDLKFDIKDEGEGFDTKNFKKLIFDTTSVNGRGFKIAKKMVDAIYYSAKGNHVILHKYIPKEL